MSEIRAIPVDDLRSYELRPAAVVVGDIFQVKNSGLFYFEGVDGLEELTIFSGMINDVPFFLKRHKNEPLGTFQIMLPMKTRPAAIKGVVEGICSKLKISGPISWWADFL